MKVILKFLMVSLLLYTPAYADEALTRKTHQVFIDRYIVNRLWPLEVNVATFRQSTQLACEANDAKNWQQVKQDFALIVKQWMGLQSMRFDAFEANNRAQRVYFWPNSRGEKQVIKFLNAKDDSKLVASYFPNISVALQGLPIVEWLLYHKDSPLFADNGSLDAYSCDYLQAIGLNVATIIDELSIEFKPGGAAREILLNPSDTNDLYSSLPEVTLQFFKAAHALVEMTHGQKLSRPIGRELKFLKPKRLEMWRAGLTKQNLLNSIIEAGEMYAIFSPLILEAENGEQVDNDIRQQLMLAMAQAYSLPDDYYEQLVKDDTGELWAQSRTLIEQLALAKNTMGVKATEALGIPLGFNALDGD